MKDAIWQGLYLTVYVLGNMVFSTMLILIHEYNIFTLNVCPLFLQCHIVFSVQVFHLLG